MADLPNRGNETLDQSEIDRLLAESLAPAPVPAFGADGRRFPDDAPPKVDPFDFRHPAFLTEGELRRLRLIHEDFLRYLAARLSLFLRMEFVLKMARLTTVTFERFTEGLSDPAHLCLFKAEPLSGVGIVELNTRLALTIADRMLGGRGHSIKSERYLTEIETALIEDVVMLMLEEWCNLWKKEQELRPSVIGHESSGRFLQTSPRGAVILALTMEAGLGDCSESIQLGVPYYMIEPVVKKMQARRQRETEISSHERRRTWSPAYEAIRVPVQVVWEAGEVSLRDVARWRAGTVLPLPGSLVERATVCLADRPTFVGRAGQQGGRTVVQITGRAQPLNLDHPHGRKKS